MSTRYFYRIEKICHRPTAEDKITIIKDIREEDLQLARIVATKNFLEEMQELKGKYSPASFEDYETKKGIGYNYQLLLVDELDNLTFIVETSMENMRIPVLEERNEEKEIFRTLGFKYSGF